MTLTEWFPQHTKPVRDGVYQTRIIHRDGWVGSSGFSQWDGREWKDTRASVVSASLVARRGMQNKEWRGLTSEAA